MGTTSSSSSDESCIEDYKFLSRLGYGGFGDVFKCVDKRTKKTVALKVSNRPWGLVREASMLKKLMDHKLDQCNIVKFYNSFGKDRCLVFEPLDISLKGHLAETKVVMQLQDIRTVIEQMAEALDALKKIGVIHTDVNTNNIMLMDRVRPFRVKLIDFGMAISRCSAEQSHIDHGYSNRAPEIILRLPFSEAIDMWSLGCVMGKMVVGSILFPGRNDYEMLQYIVDLLGLPPAHVINVGSESRDYFTETDSQHWELIEYWGLRRSDNRRYTFRSLDEVITMRLEINNKSEPEETKECINLLKAMLQWDARERIIPSEVLAHPLITRSYLNKSSSLNNCDETQSTSTESSPSHTEEPSMNQAAEPNICHSTALL